jgi:uncharacterized membrane protein YqaE (UPF0057 family)
VVSPQLRNHCQQGTVDANTTINVILAVLKFIKEKV